MSSGGDNLIGVKVSPVNPNDVLNSEYPPGLRSRFVQSVFRAYRMADALLGDVQWLDWPIGKDLKGQLRRVAVDFELKKLVESGGLSSRISYRISPNVAENCHHLVLIGTNSILTSSFVHSANKLPRPAEFRSNYGISNQYYWDFDDEYSTISMDQVPYFLLTHGPIGVEPQFIMLGMPTSDLKAWIDGSRVNLLKEPYVIDTKAIEHIEEEELTALKDFSKEVLVNEEDS